MRPLQVAVRDHLLRSERSVARLPLGVAGTFLKQPGERFQRQLNQQERFRDKIISST